MAYLENIASNDETLEDEYEEVKSRLKDDEKCDGAGRSVPDQIQQVSRDKSQRIFRFLGMGST